MSKSTKNRHNLSRYIPEKIREKIRRDAGFGCVFCGCILVEYEHIEPEYHDAKEHDPQKMTLLCPMCHDKVTKRIISKNKVWEAKASPRALENGYVSDTLMVATDSLEILLGSCKSTMFSVAIKLYGKPLFWFEPSGEGNDYKICSIFYGANGRPISYINRNEYIAIVGEQDIVSKGAFLSISDKEHGCLLEISREGDKPLHIKKLFTCLYSTKILISHENGAIRFGNIDSPDEKLTSIGGLSLAGSGYNNNAVQSALALGDIPKRLFSSPLHLAMQLSRFGKPVFGFNGSINLWVLSNKVINSSYQLVGFISNEHVHLINGEYVADYVDDQFIHVNDQYISGEPIYVIFNDRMTRNIKRVQGFDLSYRFI